MRVKGDSGGLTGTDGVTVAVAETWEGLAGDRVA
jgi:hypothetical protein